MYSPGKFWCILPLFYQLAAVGHHRKTEYENPLQYIGKLMLTSILNMSANVKGINVIQVAKSGVVYIAKMAVGQKLYHKTLFKVYHYSSIQV